MIYFRKYGRNLSQDANESLESSDQPFPPPPPPTEDERARPIVSKRMRMRRRRRSRLPFRLLPFFVVYSLGLVYPAKSYFRWKFIGLARIEASFPAARNKERYRRNDGDLAPARAKSNWRGGSPLPRPLPLFNTALR